VLITANVTFVVCLSQKNRVKFIRCCQIQHDFKCTEYTDANYTQRMFDFTDILSLHFFPRQNSETFEWHITHAFSPLTVAKLPTLRISPVLSGPPCIKRQAVNGEFPPPHSHKMLAHLADDCRLLSDVGRRALRSNSNDMPKLLVPPTHNKLGDRSFSAAGPRLWNDLPPGLRRPGLTFDSFRPALLYHLFGDRSA